MSPNELLRAARERTASPRHPDEGLTRQELAQLVNEHIWSHHRQRVEVDANYIGKLERGVIRWPSEVYREALRSVLNVPSDAALGLANPRRRVVNRPVDRKQFLRGAALLGAGALSLPPVAALLEGHEPTRSRAIAQTKLASLTMVAGDPVEAATIGVEAVDAAGTLRSRRAADDLRELARYANLHAEVGEVVELRQRIRTAVLAS